MFKAAFKLAVAGPLVLSPMALWQHQSNAGHTQLSYAAWAVQRAFMVQWNEAVRQETLAREQDAVAALVDLPGIEEEQRRAATVSVDRMRAVAAAKRPPMMRKRKEPGAGGHLCVDGVYKSFWKWDCSSCNPKDFCEHLTREKMFSRWRDCKKCNPAQWAKKKQAGMCGHHKTGCGAAVGMGECLGCLRRDCCIICFGCDCEGEAKVLKHYCYTCSPEKFVRDEEDGKLYHKWGKVGKKIARRQRAMGSD